MQWSGATGAIARCKSRSTVYARTYRSVPAWHWICGVKPKPKAGNKPSPHSIMHGLDKPGVFTTVSKKSNTRTKYTCPGCGLNAWAKPNVSLLCGECEGELVAEEGEG